MYFLLIYLRKEFLVFCTRAGVVLYRRPLQQLTSYGLVFLLEVGCFMFLWENGIFKGRLSIIVLPDRTGTDPEQGINIFVSPVLLYLWPEANVYKVQIFTREPSIPRNWHMTTTVTRIILKFCRQNHSPNLNYIWNGVLENGIPIFCNTP